MTEPREALDELLQQHEMLRQSMDECEQLADRIDAGRGDIGALVREVGSLREAFEVHNDFEELILRPLLRGLDAFAEARVDQMCADHVVEHRALRGRLDGPTAELRATLYELRSHLATEERYFRAASIRSMCS